MADWTGIRERVLALRGADTQPVFGARAHGFELEDPLSPQELAELEAQLGVELPAGYRGFLLEVGAGGAGPAYGVFPVLRKEGTWSWQGDGADLADLGLAAEPFPGRLGAELLAALHAEVPDQDDFPDADAFGKAMAAFEEETERALETAWSAEQTRGALCLCHIGCALRKWLVLTGPQRGTIWNDDRADDADLTPLLLDGEAATFDRWYLLWLEDAETKAKAAQQR
jgi:hypothetical protein